MSWSLIFASQVCFTGQGNGAKDGGGLQGSPAEEQIFLDPFKILEDIDYLVAPPKTE